MSSSRSPLTAAEDPSARTPLASWYAQGPSDGFGDRLLMFDNAATGPLELLRVRPDFALVPDFESAVRARLEQLSSFTHRGFALTRAVEHLDNGEGLTVVSGHVPGTRLSELFESTRPHAGMHPASARWALGELVSTLAELHRQGPDIAHGALAPERIVITADRHLVVTDYIFGDALTRMRLPADRLWTEFNVVPSPARDSFVVDQRTDVVQIALIVMSLVVGRRIAPGEYHGGRDRLLEEFAATAERRAPEVAGTLREWLERALSASGFKSAPDGELALVLAGLPSPTSPALPASPTAAVRRIEPSTAATETVAEPTQTDTETPDAARSSRGPVLQWAAMALGVVVLLQAAVIARLLTRSATPASTAHVSIESASAGDSVLVDGRQAGVTPMDVLVDGADRSIRIVPQAPPVAPGVVLAVSQTPQPGLDPTLGARPEAPHSGGIRVFSPIVVQVVEGEHVLGSSAGGPVFTSPGVHQLNLINNVLGYRTTQTIKVVAGRVIPLHLDPPNGSISINAQPWAQVWVDGKPMGDTPLANVSIPLGEHEVVFRHPQFGERRQKAVVQAGGSTRVSTSFSQ